MATFATEAQLEAYAQRSIDATLAQFALDVATSLIQNYTGQTIFLVEDEVVTLYPRSHEVLLPQLPVVAIDSVVSDGDPVEYVHRGSGVIDLEGSWTDSVTVTYTHGYATIPFAIVMACVQTAAALTTPTTTPGMASETEAIDDYRHTVTFSGTSGGSLSRDTMRMLDAYRHKALV